MDNFTKKGISLANSPGGLRAQYCHQLRSGEALMANGLTVVGAIVGGRSHHQTGSQRGWGVACSIITALSGELPEIP